MAIVINTEPNEVAQILTGRDYISWSAVTTYQACPLRYYFRYIAGLPERIVSASLVFGGAIHRAVEHHFRELMLGSAAPDLEALSVAYAQGWAEHEGQTVQFPKGDDRDSLDQLAARMLAAFQTSELAWPSGTILAIEEEFSGPLLPDVPDLLARVDLLVDRGDGLVLTDLKTARSRWSDSQVQESAGQLLLYHELVRPIADGRPVQLEFAIVTKAKAPQVCRYPVAAEPRQVERTKRIVGRVWEAIEAGIFYPSPSSMQCPYCPFQQECRAW